MQSDAPVGVPGDARDGGCSPSREVAPVTRYFTFGYDHRHEFDGQVFDQDTVVKITAPNPRDVMWAKFGSSFSFDYKEPPDPKFWRNGYRIVEVTP